MLFLAGIERYIVHIEDQATLKAWELSTTVSQITVYDLTPGNWYNIQVTSVGVTGRQNPEGSDILETQTREFSFSAISRFQRQTIALGKNINNV